MNRSKNYEINIGDFCARRSFELAGFSVFVRPQSEGERMKKLGKEQKLLKKSDILRVLNIAPHTFEKQLEAGIIPQPIAWVTATPSGRRWDRTRLNACFGVFSASA